MSTTVLIIAVLALVVAGLFMPVLWIVAAVLLVAGLLYVWLTASRGRSDIPGPGA